MTTRIRHLQLSGNLMLGRDTAVRMNWVSPQNRVLGAFRIGNSVNFTFKASGKNLTETISYHIVVGSIPDGTTLNSVTGVLSGIATNQQGLADFTIRAQSGSAFIDHPFRIVLGDHPSPIWDTPPGLLTIGTYNDEVESGLILVAHDPYELPVQYLVNGGTLPPGVFLDPDTGILSGTYPVLSEDFEFEFTVSATNGDTGTLRTFSIYVTGLPQAGAPIWITAPGEVGSPYELSFFSHTLHAIDLEGDPITYIRIAGNIPPNLTLDPNTGVLAGSLAAVTDDTQYKFIIGAKTPDLLDTKRMFTVTVMFDPPPQFMFNDEHPHIFANTIENQSFFTDLSANSTSNPHLQRTYVSNDLPDGFELDSTNGALYADHVPLLTDPEKNELLLNFSVTIDDGLKQAGQDFAMTILRDLPPIWVPTGNSIGEAYAETAFESAQPLAFDAYGRPVVFAIDNSTSLPFSLSFDPNTGRIFGTLPPSPDEDIVYPALITATSGANPAVKLWSFTGWHNEPPIWDTQNDLGEMIEDYDSTASVLAFDQHLVQTVVYALVDGALPDGLSLDTNTGVIFGTANAIDDPDFVVSNFTVEASYVGHILPTTRDFTLRVVKDYPPVWDTDPGLQISVLALKDFGVTLHAHDPNDTPITFSLISNDMPMGNVSINEAFASINGYLPQVSNATTYTQRWGIDDGKNPVVTRDFTFTVLPNLPPVWNTVADTVVIDDFETNEVSFQLDAFDPEGVPLIYYYTIQSNELIKTGGTLLILTSNGAMVGTLPPVSEDTEYDFTITAWDTTAERAGPTRLQTTSRNFKVMSRFNHPPTWSSSPNIFEIENHVVSMNLVATGSGNLPEIFYSLTDGSPPPGVTFYSNGALIGATQEVVVDSPYTFTVNAYNGIKAADRTFTFTVLANVEPFWVTNAGEVANTLGATEFETTLQAHDPNEPFGSLYMYLINSAVPGTVTFDAGTALPGDVSNTYINGHISGTLPFSEVDVDYGFTAAITDGLSDPIPRSFTIHNIKNQDPIWSTPEGHLATYRESKFVSLSVSAHDPEGNAVVYTMANGTNLPGTLVLYSNGTISGMTPNAITSTDYPFQVKAEEAPLHVAYRDFFLTITHNFPPTWVTNAGVIGSVLGGLSFDNAVVAADQNEDDTITYSLSGGSTPPGITLTPAGTFNGGMNLISANTDYTFSVDATDGDFTITRSFTINGLLNRPPFFTPDGMLLGTQREGTFFTTNIIATDPDGLGIKTSDFPGLPETFTYNANTGELSGVIPIFNENTTINFSYLANDGVIANVANYSIGVQFDSPPTFITPTPLPRAVESQDYATTIVATADGQDVFYSIANGALPLGINLFANGVLLGTAPSTDENQDYDVTFRAATGTKSTTMAYTLTVLKNIPPVWDTAPTLSPNVLETKFQSYTLAAEDTNDLQISYSFQGGALPVGWNFNPNGASNTAIVSGVAPTVNSDTTYTFSIGASNGFIRTDRNFSFVVKDNVPPVWNTASGVIATTTEQTPLPSTSVHATDPEGNSVTYAMNTVTHAWPAWLTLNTANGALFGTAPGVFSNTTVTFTIDASDSTLVAPRDFQINVVHNSNKFDPFANAVVFLMHLEDLNDYSQAPPRTFGISGSATLSNTQARFGASSFKGDGASLIPTGYDTNLLLETPAWTVECWVFPTTSGIQRIMHAGGYTNNSSYGWWHLEVNAGNQWTFSATTPSSNSFSFGAMALNQWQHVAVSRGTDGIIRGFVNGVMGGTLAATVHVSDLNGSLNYGYQLGGDGFNGIYTTAYIDEVRFTTKQRYVATFSPGTTVSPNPPLWITAANTVIATGPEGSNVSNATPVVAYDNDSTGLFHYVINATGVPFTYGSVGNTGVLNGIYPTLITDANYPIPTLAQDGNGNWTLPRTFNARSSAAAANNMVLSWRFNKDTTSTDFSPSTGNAVVGQPGISGGSMTYAQAPAPHATETAAWTGNTGTGLSWSTGVGKFNFLSGSFTLEMWVYMAGGYPQTSGGANRALFIITPSAFNSNFRLFRYESAPSPTGNMAMTFMDINRPAGCPTGQDLVPNAWQHVAFTRNALTTTNTLWLNGVAGPSTTTPNPAIGTFDNASLLINPAASTAYTNVFYHSIIFWNVIKYSSTFTPVWPGY